MKLPRPEPGLVIRYAYLWAREAAEGREEGTKDRPCAIVVVVRGPMEAPVVRVLPVTHRPPENPQDALEIPFPTKLRLGLDGERSWIVLTEANEFGWPGPDLRPVRLSEDLSFAYGVLPPKFFEALKRRLVEARARLVRRTE